MVNKNRKNKTKGIGLSLATGILSAGTIMSPVSVFANELIEYGVDEADNFAFNYKKNGDILHGGVEIERASYALVLKKGIDENGKEFEPTEEQKLEAFTPFKASDKESRIQVKYKGIYDLVNINREPGYYPILKDSLIINDGYFEFPRSEEETEKKVILKEDLFLAELELILRNPENIGLRGDFELNKIAAPAKVYSKNMSEIMGLTEYNNPKLRKILGDLDINYNPSKGNVNETYKWIVINEGYDSIKIDKDGKVRWKIDEEDNGEVEFAKRREGGITEGIYSITQKSSEVGYLKRTEGISFKVTLDANGEPVLEVLNEFIDINEKKDGDEIYNSGENKNWEKHDLEYFKVKDYKDDINETLYQALLVNFPIVGLKPIKPTDPDNPNRPNSDNPAYENAFTKEGFKYEKEEIEDDKDKVYSENTQMKGTHIKVNVGEKFGLNFDIQMPENLDEYEEFVFADPMEDKVKFGDSYDKKFEEYWEGYPGDDTGGEEEPPGWDDEPPMEDFLRTPSNMNTRSNIPNTDFIENYPVQIFADGVNLADMFNLKDVFHVEVNEEGNKGVSLSFKGDSVNSNAVKNYIKGKTLTVEIKDLYLEEGTREDIYNRGYIYYKIRDGENTIPEDPMKHPDPKDVLDPNKPGYPLEQDPDNPITEENVVDPNNPNKPFIPTTPEIIIDPITVDFRMGVVDQGTNILNDATYKITSFIPSRGDGGIDDDGELYIGTEKIGVNAIIDNQDVKDGFVKLADLPAGRYRMVETTAPVKGEDEYRLVTKELVFHVNEDEEFVYIESPIVKNDNEMFGKKINAKELYRVGDTDKRNEDSWNNPEVNKDEAMLHHYRYINTPETGTLAGIPFFLGGGVLVSAGIAINKKRKED